MEVLVFKTDILTPLKAQVVNSRLQNLAGIFKATVDLEDKDKVLRILTDEFSPNEIKSYLRMFGVNCSELADE